MKKIEEIFTDIGGTFICSPEEIALKLKNIRAFVFDWDGVFNDGEKKEGGTSIFSETDSMGVNLLRFSFWLDRHRLPFTAIISGERNAAAFWFCKREHLDASYYKVSHKIEALDHLCKKNSISHDQVAFVFDDVADLSIAHVCGIRLMVSRKSNPLFFTFVRQNGLADYITGSPSGSYPVRECCELLMGLSGNYEETISKRSAFGTIYLEYREARDKISPGFYTRSGSKIAEKKP